MRKLAVLTSALLILAACSAVPAEELTPAYPTASNVQNTSGPETLTYQIETHTWEDSVRTEDGTMLAWYRFHLPEMSVLQADGTPLETADTPAEQEALEAAEVFNTRFSSWISQEEFESMTQEAAGELELFRENEMECVSCEIKDLPARPPKTTRMHIQVQFTSQTEGVILLTDQGFGSLFPGTGKVTVFPFTLIS